MIALGSSIISVVMSDHKSEIIDCSRVIGFCLLSIFVIRNIEDTPKKINVNVGTGSEVFAIRGAKKVKQFPKDIFSSKLIPFNAGLYVFDSYIM